MFKNGVLVNRLKGLHTTQEIADAFQSVNKLSNFFVGPYDTKFAKGLSDAYKYVFLYSICTKLFVTSGAFAA